MGRMSIWVVTGISIELTTLGYHVHDKLFNLILNSDIIFLNNSDFNYISNLLTDAIVMAKNTKIEDIIADRNYSETLEAASVRFKGVGTDICRNIDPKKMFKFKDTQSNFGAHVFPNISEPEVTDVDVVLLGLLYILCKGILGNDKNDKVCVEWFLLVDDPQAWDSFPWRSYLFCHAYKCMQECFGKIKRFIQSGKKNGLRYTVSGYTVPFWIWIWEMLPQLSLINAGRVGTSLPRMVQWVQVKKIEWSAISDAFKIKKTNNNMRATDEERQQLYYQSYKAYIIGQVLEIPFPLRYLLKDEYLIISTDERFSPPQSLTGSPENLSRRDVVLENLEGRVRELEKKVNIQASNECNYSYDIPKNYDNIYTEFSPTDCGPFDHLNKEPNEEPKQEPNEEPKQEPNKKPKVEPNEETIVEVGVVELGSDANEETVVEVGVVESRSDANEETGVEVGIEELGPDANQETVLEVRTQQYKARRARKRGFACKSPILGEKKRNASATRPLIMIPRDNTRFSLQSYVGKGEGFPMYYIRRDAIIEQYHRYSGRSFENSYIPENPRTTPISYISQTVILFKKQTSGPSKTFIMIKIR
ncbi:hypothetical protein LXL04_006263 [Taraxacum kok-saghyz]